MEGGLETLPPQRLHRSTYILRHYNRVFLHRDRGGRDSLFLAWSRAAGSELGLRPRLSNSTGGRDPGVIDLYRSQPRSGYLVCLPRPKDSLFLGESRQPTRVYRHVVELNQNR